MSRCRFTLPSLLLVLGLPLGGCVLHTPHLQGVVTTMEHQLPGTHFESDSGVRFGRFSLGLAGRLVAHTEDDPDAKPMGDIFRELDRVEMGTYRVEGPVSVANLEPTELLGGGHWLTLARIQHPGEVVWVLYQEHRGSIHTAMVMALDGDELTLVHLEGRLDRVITAAMDVARQQAES